MAQDVGEPCGADGAGMYRHRLWLVLWFSIWRSQATSAARTPPASTAAMRTSLSAMAKSSSCSPPALVRSDARPRAQRMRSVFEQQQVGHYLLCRLDMVLTCMVDEESLGLRIL